MTAPVHWRQIPPSETVSARPQGKAEIMTTLGPRAQELFKQGALYLDSRGCVMGIAADGEHLSMPPPVPALEDYLAEYPTPDMW